MKRYMFNAELQKLKLVETDVVIVGCGVAGLYAALNLAPQVSCVVLNKAGPLQSNSMYAQGGIATVIEPNNEQDDWAQHLADTLVAGAGLCDEQAVKILVEEAWSNITQLINMQVPFDRQAGELLLTREGGHGKDRILHCGGDATGSHLTRKLYQVAKEKQNITILDKVFLTDILTDENGVSGVLALDKEDKICYFTASKVIIASGGVGRVYRNSTNAICATGDGIAAAMRAGAELKDMEFVQFHPTALIYPNDSGRFFLISEALRGEGAILRNRRWEAFMQGIHPLADLAPRDIVARAIISEMKKSNIPHVFLDITTQTRSFLRHRFPTIYEECMSRGIDIAKDWIPVMPVQHYFMGGIKTDTEGQTNVLGLYACGEAACTGVHGANRLASNSLLECLVFGRRCAQHINDSNIFAPAQRAFPMLSSEYEEIVDFDAYSSEIRNLMTRKCSIIRNAKELAAADERIKKIAEQLEQLNLATKKGIETYNQALVALAILEASTKRKKSVGAHYRSDEEQEGEDDDVK
ncbi:MAG: L-aspartate oxidase [Clostridia bacterium]